MLAIMRPLIYFELGDRNTCQIEWPPKSGRLLEVPEVDCGRWFSLQEAREHILKSQEPFLDGLSALFSAFEQG